MLLRLGDCPYKNTRIIPVKVLRCLSQKGFITIALAHVAPDGSIPMHPQFIPNVSGTVWRQG